MISAVVDSERFRVNFHMGAVLWHQITTARTAGAGSDDSKKAEL